MNLGLLKHVICLGLRREIAFVAVRKNNYKVKEVADILGVDASAISKALKRKREKKD